MFNLTLLHSGRQHLFPFASIIKAGVLDEHWPARSREAVTYCLSKLPGLPPPTSRTSLAYKVYCWSNKREILDLIYALAVVVELLLLLLFFSTSGMKDIFLFCSRQLLFPGSVCFRWHFRVFIGLIERGISTSQRVVSIVAVGKCDCSGLVFCYFL